MDYEETNVSPSNYYDIPSVYITIIESPEKGQLFVSVPKYRTKLVDENNRLIYQDACYPVTKEFRENFMELFLRFIKRYVKNKPETR